MSTAVPSGATGPALGTPARSRLHVGFVYVGVPSTGHGGASLMAFTVVSALLQAGHAVTALALTEHSHLDWEQSITRLTELGAGIRHIRQPLPERRPISRLRRRAAYARELVWPTDEALFPWTRQADDLRSAFDQEGLDVGLAFGIEAVAASHAGVGVPPMALTGDPPGLSRRMRMKYDPTMPWGPRPRQALYRAGQLSYWLHADRRFLAMLRRFPTVGFFGAQHAEWARAHGVAAWHAPAPVADLGGPDWARRRTGAPRPPRPRILMMGHLRGISTIAGLQLFADSILPSLSERLGADGFEVRIVGGYEPPPELLRRLRHPAVRLCGQVVPPDDEFLTADVMLVPTPIVMGQRTRIATAMSFGCPVVAHSANRFGLPELVHADNVLLADTGPGLADAVLLALTDSTLRERLVRSGRRTYEGTFAPEKAAARIVRALERVAEGSK